MTPNAEAAVIAACIADPELHFTVSDYLSPDDFTDPLLRTAYDAIGQQLAKDRPVDIVTLSDDHDLHLGDLAAIVQDYPSTNGETYARMVKRSAINRRALAVISKYQGAIAGGDPDAMTTLQAELEKLASTQHRAGYLTFPEVLRAGMGDIEEARERRKAGVTGLTFGLPELDHTIGGLRGPKLLILAARPSLGKTALALQMALNSANHGHAVGICSLEMSGADIAVRSMAHEYDVNNTSLARGDDEAVRAIAAKAKSRNIKDLPLFVDEDTYTPGGIVSRAIEWHRKHAIEALIVDHLQLVEVPGDRNRNDSLGDVTRALKLLAKRLNIPVILVCQLNRLVEREKRRPKLSDLRDSGNIEQDADIVMMLHGELEGTGHSGDRDVEIGFVKFRGGRVGWLGSRTIFHGTTQRFREIADPDGVYRG